MEKKRSAPERKYGVYFDQDYPTETQKKRKVYAPIRKLLKEKGLRFQTPPPARLWVFFDSGPVTYSRVDEAMADLKKRGLATDGDRGERRNAPAPAAIERRKKNSWETVNAKRKSQTAS